MMRDMQLGQRFRVHHTSIMVTDESVKASCPTAAGIVFRVNRDANSSLDKVSSCITKEQSNYSSY